MKKSVFIIAILAFIIFNVNSIYAQESYQDVVYLKNGSIIHGIIIEQVPNQTLKIQTKDGNVFVYKFDEVLKLTREKLQNQENENNYTENGNTFSKSTGKLRQKEKGFINYNEFTSLFGVNDITKDMYGICLESINGYKFNNYFSLGGGTGFDFLFQNSATGILLPIYIDARVNFMKGNVSPYLAFDLGYSVGLSNVTGGVLVSPSLGVNFLFANNSSLNIGLGLRIQNILSTYVDSYPVYHYDYYYSYYTYEYYTYEKRNSANFFNLKIGYSFQ